MHTNFNNTVNTLLIREGIKNGTVPNWKWPTFFKYPSPQCKCNILEYETRTFIETFFFCFLCLQLLKVFHVLHSGPTIPFEDGELPQDTCRARGKADIRYSMHYHFEIRNSKDYHVKTYCRWTWRLSWFQLAIQIWSWNGSSGKKGNTGPIYSAFLSNVSSSKLRRGKSVHFYEVGMVPQVKSGSLFKVSSIFYTELEVCDSWTVGDS